MRRRSTVVPILLTAGLAGAAVAAADTPGVTHKSRGVAPGEAELYGSYLAEVGDIDAARFRADAAATTRERIAATGWDRDTAFPLYRDLIASPAAYEGRAVTFVGTLRRVTKLSADPPRWESWLFPEGGEGHPVVVVSAAKPPYEDLPTDLTTKSPVDVNTDIEATGRFFKLYGYQAGDGPRFAPLIVAGPMRAYGSPRRPAVPDWAVYAFGGVTALYATWRITRVVGRLRPQRKAAADLPDEIVLPDEDQDAADPLET
ncbi:MAG: hypothetical protein AAF532_09945 [Planctomycetota bacterium]